MKKLCAWMLALALLSICCSALAGGIAASADDAALIKALGLDADAKGQRLDALNRLIRKETDMALITQQELIEALQGYADGDVKTDLQWVQALAQNDLYLLCAAQTAQDAGISDLASLRDYLAENGYALFIMRSFQAGNADYAAMLLMQEMDFDSEMFVDDQDKMEHLADGAYVLVADTAQALALAQEGHAVLGPLTAERTKEFPDLPCAAECGLPQVRGAWYALVARAGADLSAWQAISLDEDALADLHLHAPDADISLPADIDAYVDYMTEEGLFFY